MGLESANYTFCSEKEIKELLNSNIEIVKKNEKLYFINSESSFIEIEVLSKKCISIQIVLCNPIDQVLKKLEDLLAFMLLENEGSLKDMYSKVKISSVFEMYLIRDSYRKQQFRFQTIYGNYINAIDSDGFYKLVDSGRIKRL